VTIPHYEMPYRDPEKVDAVVGKKRVSPEDDETIDWASTPIGKKYPRWHNFLQAIAEEREAAAKENREAHPATRMKRHIRNDHILPPVPAPWDIGPSCGAVNAKYKTTDKGR
jgi:hypothetical protein